MLMQAMQSEFFEIYHISWFFVGWVLWKKFYIKSKLHQVVVNALRSYGTAG